MSTWSAAAQNYLDELAARPAAMPPATLGEVWNAEWKSAGLGTLTGSGKPTMDAYRELFDAVEGQVGNVPQAARDRGLDFWSAREVDGKTAVLARIIDTLPEEQRKKLDPLRDVRSRAAERAAAIERDQSEVAGRSYGLSATATGWAAGVTRHMVDPVNLALAPLGGEFGGPLLPMLARQAGAAMFTQAIQEPIIQKQRGELGLEAGFLPAAKNVLEAGAGGLAMPLAVRYGLAPLFRAGARAWRSNFATDVEGGAGAAGAPAATPGTPAVTQVEVLARAEKYAEVRRRLSELNAEDLDAAAHLAERDAVIDSQAPAQTVAGRELHAARVDEAAAALEQGRRPAIEAVPGELADAPPTGSIAWAPGFAPQRVAYREGDAAQLIRPGGERLTVRPAVVELSDLTVSHAVDGAPNPNYPAELQPRDRSGAASRSFVAEKAAELEPELLAHSPTAATGAPVIGPDGIVESGNGRVLMIARAYDRHPERAAAYRAMLEAQGYNLEGFKFPVLARVREGELAGGARAAFAREANVSPTAGLSVRERAFADARGLDENLMALYRPGDVTSPDNVPFVRAFAAHLVAAEDRPQFVSSDNRLSADGVRRVEAAMVARAWGAEDVVAALYEAADPSSRAILGALADTAPAAARLRAALEEGRVPAEGDPAGPILDAYRLVDRARATGQKVGDLVKQLDIELGAVPDAVAEAARLFFRDDAMRLGASREAIAARIDKAVQRALDQQNAVGDLFGGQFDAAGILKGAQLAGRNLEDLPLAAGERAAGETDKQFAKRVVDQREAPAELPEDHARYFAIDQDTKSVPLADLVSSKSAAENAQGAENGAKRMAAAAAGELERRAPITVTPLEGGKYLVVDGNGTLSSVQKYGWQSLPVKIEPPLFSGPSGIVERGALPLEQFKGRRAALVAQQPFDSIDQALEHAAANQSRLVAALEEAGAGKVVDNGIKTDRPRMAQKVEEKYQGNVRGLTDLVRAGVEVATPHAGEKLAAWLAKKFRVIDEGWKVNEAGYLDRKLEVVMPDGQIAEVQMWPPAIAAAKEEGEAMYKRRRVAAADAQAAMLEHERAFWKDVQSKVGEEWSGVLEAGGSPKAPSSSANALRASSSEISRPSQVTSAAETGRQPLAPIESAEPPRTTASVSPQEKNLSAIGPSAQKVIPPGEKLKVGDQALAQDADRVLNDAGGDLAVVLENPDGSTRQVSARAAIAEAEDQARAAAELADCIGEAA